MFEPLPFRHDTELTCHVHDRYLRVSKSRPVQPNNQGTETVAHDRRNSLLKRRKTFRSPRVARPTHLTWPRTRSLSLVGDAAHLGASMQSWNA